MVINTVATTIIAAALFTTFGCSPKEQPKVAAIVHLDYYPNDNPIEAEEIIFPRKDTPYWSFITKDGRKIRATGNVFVEIP